MTYVVDNEKYLIEYAISTKSLRDSPHCGIDGRNWDHIVELQIIKNYINQNNKYYVTTKFIKIMNQWFNGQCVNQQYNTDKGRLVSNRLIGNKISHFGLAQWSIVQIDMLHVLKHVLKDYANSDESVCANNIFNFISNL